MSCTVACKIDSNEYKCSSDNCSTDQQIYKTFNLSAPRIAFIGKKSKSIIPIVSSTAVIVIIIYFISKQVMKKT
jgi:hypothetical protein